MSNDPRFVLFVKTPLGEYILSSRDAVYEDECDEAILDITAMLRGVRGTTGELESGLDIVDRYGRRVFIPVDVLRNSIIGFYNLEDER